MDHFLYKNGILHAEEVALPEIAAAVGTPFYVYSTATLERHYRLFTEALSPLPHLVCFAIKSLSNIAVLKVLGDLGAGMDVVSGGEYRRAKAAGVPGSRIVFSGVGKTRDEMRLALEGGIRQFNVGTGGETPEMPTVAIHPNSEVRATTLGVLKLSLFDDLPRSASAAGPSAKVQPSDTRSSTASAAGRPTCPTSAA